MTWLWANIYSIMFVFCYIFWRKSRRRRGCLAVLFFFLHSCLFFFRNILEQYVFKTTLCIIFPSLSSSYLFSSIIFWRKRSSGCLAGLSIRRRLVYSPPTGLLCCGESLQPWSRSTLATFHNVFVEREKERFIPSHNNAKKCSQNHSALQ